MKKTIVIAVKEFRSYFLSPIGYAVVCSFLFMVGYMFYQRLVFFVKQSFVGDQIQQQIQMSLNDAVIKPLYGTINILLLFVVPIITMRLISEEKKTRTIELLLSSPVNSWQIITGKFTGAMLLILSALLGTFVYPVVLYLGGNPDMGQVVAMYIGMIFLSSVYVATGLLWSSITENQIISAILTFVSLLFFWTIDWSIQNSSQTVSDILSYVSVIKHFEYFGQGVLSLKDTIYYVSLGFMLLYVSKQFFYDRSKKIKKILKLVSMFIVVVLVNVSANLHDYRLDITKEKLNSLSQQTQNVLRTISEDVHFSAVLVNINDEQIFKRAMEQYLYYTDKISYEVTRDDTPGYNKGSFIIVSSKKRSRQINSISEEDITSSIVAVTRDNIKKIYFTSDHGEKKFEDEGVYSLVTSRLRSYGYELAKLDLYKGVLPNDIGLLIISTPSKKFFQNEVKIIEKFINSGGNLIVLSDPKLPKASITAQDNVNLFLAKFGLSFNGQVIIDPSSKLFGINQAIPVVKDFNQINPITKLIKSPAIFPYAQGINIKTGIANLCSSSDSSWGEHNVGLDKIFFDKNLDTKGPITLCAYTCVNKDSGCIFAVGNSNFINDQYIDYGSNYDLFMNAVSFMIKDDLLISIRPKIQQAGYFNPNSGFVLGFIIVYIVPVVLMIVGFFVWHRRKKK